MTRMSLVIALLCGLAGPLRGQRLGLLVGGLAQPARRVASLGNDGGTATGTMTGVDATLRLGLLRLEIRTGTAEFAGDSGSFGGGKVTTGSGSLGVGGGTFWLTGGVGRHAYSSGLGRRVWSFTQVAGGASFSLGNALRGEVTGGVYLNAKEIDGPTSATGRFGQTALRYEPRQFPAYLLVGYRAETFTPNGTPGSSPDEVRGLVGGAGVRVGG